MGEIMALVVTIAFLLALVAVPIHLLRKRKYKTAVAATVGSGLVLLMIAAGSFFGAQMDSAGPVGSAPPFPQAMPSMFPPRAPPNSPIPFPRPVPTSTPSLVEDGRKVIYCEVLQDRVARSECNYFDEIWAKLEEGEAAIDAPSIMVRGEKSEVIFAITRDPNASPLGELLPNKPTETFKTKVGRRMAAKLQGQGFTVDPTGLVFQDLFVGDGVVWKWDVIPVRAPRHRLTLSAYVAIRTQDGKDKENLIRTVYRDVAVEVPVGARVMDFMDDSIDWMGRANNWLLALAGLIGGGVLALWLLVPKFRRPKPEQPG